MIRSICCVCGIQYGTKQDGRAETSDSHGYCERCYDEIMLTLKTKFADLPTDRISIWHS